MNTIVVWNTAFILVGQQICIFLEERPPEQLDDDQKIFGGLRTGVVRVGGPVTMSLVSYNS